MGDNLQSVVRQKQQLAIDSILKHSGHNLISENVQENIFLVFKLKRLVGNTKKFTPLDLNQL